LRSAGLFAGRAAGVLLHPTSLPGHGIGDLGEPAYRFVDWLAAAGQSYWQILPLVPVDRGGSPYNGLAAMAGNPLLIAVDDLVRTGLLDRDEGSSSHFPGGKVDYEAVSNWKSDLLRRAFERFRRSTDLSARRGFDLFQQTQRAWLEDYAHFRALRDLYGEAAWITWPERLRGREPAALERSARELALEIEFHAFLQYVFQEQWRALRSYARSLGVEIIGDIPIFVAHDSADVWAHPEFFQLDGEGSPLVVAGVPPDYFSATGQRWGNPLYRWDALATDGYRWWVDRFRRALEFVDVVRVDHFRGFQAYWEIDASEETAVHGRWVDGPGLDLFREVERRLGRLPLIAEDLGIITPEVDRLREDLGLPGMRVLQFAFDGDPQNPHLPSNYTFDTVAYTGTHDNDTIMGWWSSASSAERRVALEYLDHGALDHWSFIEMVMASRAGLAVVPLQDVLGLGASARMNTPGVSARNWAWGMTGPASAEAGQRLRQITYSTGRRPVGFSSASESRSEDAR
jgi:4-alpha-glucanotransferase